MRLRISVIGVGYLGATHAACLADLGFEVLGIDRDRARLARLAAGELPFVEPDLPELLRRHTATGALRFEDDVATAARWADVHFVCVGTPQSVDGTAADLGAVRAVVTDLARHADRDCLIVVRSTVPTGTLASLRDLVDALARPGVRIGLAANPEFLREGHAVQDTLRPDRIVLGTEDLRDELLLRRIHADAIAAGCPVRVTSPATAELAKGAANSFLALKISYANALAEMADAAGADVLDLADVLGDDVRIGRRFLGAGVGFGGGCLPKDIRALSARAGELGAHRLGELLETVDAINLAARRRLVDLALAELSGSRHARVAVLGAAFKPGSDDVRDSPALAVARSLHEHGAEVRVFDPQAALTARAVAPELTYVAGPDAALAGAALTLHLTEWPEFAHLDPERAGRLVAHRRLIDGRLALDAERWRRAGWAVRAFGRPLATDRAVTVGR
ncbi:UDP-glucose/GDP-mannose dehydrogenase family protein [Alteromonas gracilis]